MELIFLLTKEWIYHKLAKTGFFSSGCFKFVNILAEIPGSFLFSLLWISGRKETSIFNFHFFILITWLVSGHAPRAKFDLESGSRAKEEATITALHHSLFFSFQTCFVEFPWIILSELYTLIYRCFAMRINLPGRGKGKWRKRLEFVEVNSSHVLKMLFMFNLSRTFLEYSLIFFYFRFTELASSGYER